MEFDDFLKAALGRLGYDWRRHRRRGVRRKVLERARRSGARDLQAYLALIGSDPAEAELFRSLLTVTISRFYRDPPVFEKIAADVLPDVLERRGRAEIWSCGAASGEEPYTLAVIAAGRFPEGSVGITATDIDAECIRRAAEGVYTESSLRQMPGELLSRWFRKSRGGYAIDGGIKKRVKYVAHDVLAEEPPGVFDVVLCRNLAYTYFGAEQRELVTRKLYGAMNPGGYLVIGRTESLPGEAGGLFELAFAEEKIFRRRG